MHDAPGLPDRSRFTPIREIPRNDGTIWPFVMHRHHAERAGLHHDLRIGDRKAGVAHSWAYKSGKLPGVGERIEVFQQPDHTIPYMKFRGKIEKGYGKGDVDIAQSGHVEVLDSSPTKLHFRLSGRRFVLVKTPRYGERSWLFIGLPDQKKVAVHLVPTPDLAEEMLKAADDANEEARARDRAVGQGLGSAATHLVTGYGIAPWMHPATGVEKPTLSSLKQHGLKGSLKRYWGGQALGTGAAMAGVALLGGMMKERIQAGYEKWREKGRQKTADDHRAYPGCAKCMTEPMPHCANCRRHVSTDWKTGLCAECEEQNERRRARTPFAKAASVLEGFVHTAEDEAETLRMQLAACGVAAMSPKGHLPRSNPYYSASLGDVKRLYDEKERLREVVRDRVGEDEALPPEVRGILKAASATEMQEIGRNSVEIREKVETEAGFDPRESVETSRNGEKTATGLLVYTNHPSERPSAPLPKPTKGFAKAFGNRFNPSVSRHRHAERTADEWMRSSAEYVDLGTRPNLAQTAREVFQIEPGKPFSRSDALRMLSQRKNVRSDAITRRRAGVLRGMEQAQDSPEEAKELLDALETVTKHPRARYFELTEKN